LPAICREYEEKNPMLFISKVIISAVVIALASEVSKYNRLVAAIIISLPLTSLLTFIWIYLDTKDTQKITALSYDVFWLALISLIFFLIFPAFVKYGFSFWVSVCLSCIGLVGTYFLFVHVRSYF
jgi:inner membrane protein involved in colicin E2 resistance